MKILTLLFLFFLFSCNNFRQNIQDNVSNQVDNAKQEMQVHVNSEKEKFSTRIKKIANNRSDTNSRLQLQELNLSVMTTAAFLDSLQTEMNKLNDLDLKNIELIKNIFLYRGIGDTIQNRLKKCINLSQRISQNNESKTNIQSMSDSLFNGYNSHKWTELNFGQTNPLGATMILYGLQLELFSIGLKSLED